MIAAAAGFEEKQLNCCSPEEPIDSLSTAEENCHSSPLWSAIDPV
jgi:hypothetical protein